MNRSLLLSLSLCLLAISSNLGNAAEKDAQSKFKSLIREMLEARKKFQSGEARIEGLRRASDDRGGRLNGKVKGTYCFEAATNSYRFQSEVPCNLILQSEGNHKLPKPGQKGKRYHVKYWACRNPNYFAETEDIPGTKPHVHSNLNIRRPEYDSREQSRSLRRRPFDPLSAGIIGYFETAKGKEAGEVYKGMLGKTVESYKSDGKLITIELKDKLARHTLVVDKALMAPLKLVSRSLTDPSVFTSKAAWKVIDDVAIPVTLATNLNYPKIVDQGFEFKFHWSRINKPIDKSEFQYTTFTGLPRNITDIFDNRGKEPKYVGRLIADGIVVKPNQFR